MDLYKLDHISHADVQKILNILQLFHNDGAKDIQTIMTVLDRVVVARIAEHRKEARKVKRKQREKDPELSEMESAVRRSKAVCPRCQSPMLIEAVNVVRNGKITKCTRLENPNYKSWAICQNGECQLELYLYKKPYNVEFADLHDAKIKLEKGADK